MAKVHRKQYWVVFAVLTALTLLEVAVAQVPGIAHGLLVSALVLLAVAKASFVMLFYMHLKSETGVLRLTVLAPFAIPALYAIVLILDAGWRYVLG